MSLCKTSPGDLIIVNDNGIGRVFKPTAAGERELIVKTMPCHRLEVEVEEWMRSIDVRLRAEFMFFIFDKTTYFSDNIPSQRQTAAAASGRPVSRIRKFEKRIFIARASEVLRYANPRAFHMALLRGHEPLIKLKSVPDLFRVMLNARGAGRELLTGTAPYNSLPGCSAAEWNDKHMASLKNQFNILQGDYRADYGQPFPTILEPMP